MSTLYCVVMGDKSRKQFYPFIGMDQQQYGSKVYTINQWWNVDCFSYCEIGETLLAAYKGQPVSNNQLIGDRILTGVKQECFDFLYDGCLFNNLIDCQQVYDYVVGDSNHLDIRVAAIESFGQEHVKFDKQIGW